MVRLAGSALVQQVASPPFNRLSTAFAGALAGVLFAAGGHSTLQTDPLAASPCGDGVARQWNGTGGGFAICFGNDFVAHVNFQKKGSEYARI